MSPVELRLALEKYQMIHDEEYARFQRGLNKCHPYEVVTCDGANILAPIVAAIAALQTAIAQEEPE